MELLKELCEAPGIPGREERLRAIVRRELEPIVDEIRVDAMGNLICVKKKDGAPKLMIAAHMDEIGFVVSHIDEKKGWVRLVGLGGHDPRNMIAQRVTVCAESGDLPGVLYPGIKPPHIQTSDDSKKQPVVSDFFVDLGLPGEKSPGTRAHRRYGDHAPGFRRDRRTASSAKALDNRVAVYVMIRAMQAAQRFGFEVYAVATTQEEVGLRGALTSAYGIRAGRGHRTGHDAGSGHSRRLRVRVSYAARQGRGHQDSGRLGDREPEARCLSARARRQPRHRCGRTRSCRAAVRMQARCSAYVRAWPQASSRSRRATFTARWRRCIRTDVKACIALLAAFVEEGNTADLALD